MRGFADGKAQAAAVVAGLRGGKIRATHEEQLRGSGTGAVPVPLSSLRALLPPQKETHPRSSHPTPHFSVLHPGRKAQLLSFMSLCGMALLA